MEHQENERELQERLRKEIAASETRMRNCRHEFNEPIFDPEKVSVQDDRQGYEVHGVDRWPVLSFHEESKRRWSRECKDCGFKEYTYEQEAEISSYKPKFK